VTAAAPSAAARHAASKRLADACGWLAPLEKGPPDARRNPYSVDRDDALDAIA